MPAITTPHRRYSCPCEERSLLRCEHHAIETDGQRGADELRSAKAKHVRRIDAGETLRQERAIVTAGFANDVDAVNQYAAEM